MVGSTQETQRLLSEPGAGAFQSAVSGGFLRGVAFLGLISVRYLCSTGDQRFALGGEHAVLQRHDPWAGTVALRRYFFSIHDSDVVCDMV